MDLVKGQRFIQHYTVTPKVYLGFMACFNDLNPLHTNAELAKSKGFNAEVMHGNILGGFLSHFIGECLPVKELIIHSQEILYKNPVYLNDELRLEVEVTDYFESVAAVTFDFKFSQADAGLVAKGKFQIGILK